MNFVQANLLRATRAITANTRLKGRYVLSEMVINRLNVKKDSVQTTIGKYQLKLSLNDLIERQIYFGLYDNEEVALLKRLLKPGDVFFDIGANVGFYSLNASQIVGDTGSVHAFEPMPPNIARLSAFIDQNHIKNIRVNQVAVGETEGSLTLHYSDENWGNSAIASIVETPLKKISIVVPAITIASYVQQNNIPRVRLIKLDIEGAELMALNGMEKILALPDAPDLMIEINPFLLTKQGTDSRVLTEWIAARGYSLHLLGQETALDPSRIVDTLVNLHCYKVPH